MLSQSFGAESSANEADTITAVEFDNSGDYLATGDHGGRVVLFARMTPPPVVPEDKERSKRRKDIGTSPGDDERRGKSLNKVGSKHSCKNGYHFLLYLLVPFCMTTSIACLDSTFVRGGWC